jgi:3-hydroxybutyryl-CoA dehydrogenase
MMAEIKSVGIIGAGTMGQGITQLCSQAGFNVLLYDIQSASVDEGISKISASLQNLVDKNKISIEEKASALSRISRIDSLADFKCELVIEAAVENLKVKQEIFAALERVLAEEAILTSNTSSIPITQIAAQMKNPGRFAGLHFFNPAPVMKLVEIITGANTTQETIKILHEFCRHIGKQSVLAQDSPGFIVNRVARHYYVESLKLIEEQVSDIHAVDSLLRSTGFKMGPFELMDLIGVDVNFAVTSSMYNAFHQDPKFRPSRTQQQKVDAGQNGRKSGRGFYDYKK